MNLDQAIQRHFQDVQAAGGRRKTTILAAPQQKGFPKFKDQLNRKLQHALKSFNDHGHIDRLSNELKTGLDDAYQKAYEMGAGTKDISKKERAWLEEVRDKQFAYLDGFLSDVNADEGRMMYSQRLTMYTEKVDSMYWSGAVKSLEEGTLIYWVTMPGENCEDCLELEENGPYTPEELPTVPRIGDTQCIGNCHCLLVTSKEK